MVYIIMRTITKRINDNLYRSINICVCIIYIYIYKYEWILSIQTYTYVQIDGLDSFERLERSER